jgi:tetratricopeptide (TPR) repeat protein
VGALVGLLAEGRATSALLLLPALALALPAEPGRRRAWARSALALVSGFSLITAPVALRNFAVGGEWIPFTYNLGFNLYVGNNPGATGGFVYTTGTQQIGPAMDEAQDGGAGFDGREYLRTTEGVRLTPAASSAYWAAKAGRYARAHPARVAALTTRKLVMLWNRREYPQIENVEEYGSLAGPIGLPGLGSFWLVGALALAGLWFAGRYGAAGRFLAGYALVTTLGIAPFFIADRYRCHLVPAAALLAAIFLDRAWAARKGTGPSAHLPAALALAAGLAVVHLPAPEMSRGQYAWEASVDLGTRWLEGHRPELAVREFEKALAAGPAAAPPGAAGAALALERATLYRNYAVALTQLGHADRALSWFERAVAMAPDHPATVRALGDTYARMGRWSEAESTYARLARLPGGAGPSLEARGLMAARKGDLQQAEQLFRAAVSEDPGLSGAWGALIRAQAQEGRFLEAAQTLERARQAGLRPPALYAYEALVASTRGEVAAAEEALAKVPAADLAADPVLADVVRVTRVYLSRRR